MCPAPSRATRPPSPGHQRGAMLLIILTLMATAFAAALLGGLSRLPTIFADPVDSQTRKAMDDAKAALTVWARTRDPANAASPGLLPYPDRNGFEIPTPTARESDCPAPGGGVAALNNPVLRLGQIPASDTTNACKTDGLAGNNSLYNRLTDSSGTVLWMAVSQNLTDDNVAGGVVAAVSTDLLNPAHPTAAARWLSVCDEQGRLLTNRAAYVVLAPMSAIGGQNRVGTTNPNQFLEQMSIAGTAPCNGLIRNNQNNLVYLSLQGASTANFNDRLLFVTAEQHLGAAAHTVATDIANQIRTAGALPADEPALSTVPGMPQYLVGPNYLANPAGWFVALTYIRLSATNATITFANCAITFTINTAGWPNGNGLSKNATNC